MTWIVAKRVSTGVLQLAVVVFLIFVLVSASPGDPAARVAGEAATVEEIAQIPDEIGLNRPLVAQFVDRLGSAVTGDLSQSLVFPVLRILGARVSQLMGGTVVIETVFNIQGMGRTLVDAALNADIDVVLGVTVVATLAVIVTNLLIELVQPVLNRRLRTR